MEHHASQDLRTTAEKKLPKTRRDKHNTELGMGVIVRVRIACTYMYVSNAEWTRVQ